MIVFSFEVPRSDTIAIVLVLNQENIDRIQQSNPLDLTMKDLSGIDLSKRIRDLAVVIAFEEDLNQMIEFQQKQDLVGFMRWLERGRKIQLGGLTGLEQTHTAPIVAPDENPQTAPDAQRERGEAEALAREFGI